MLEEEIRPDEAEAQEQDVPKGDEEAPSEGGTEEAPERVEVSKEEWDALQKKLRSFESTVSKNKSRERELEEIKQVLRDRDENNKKRFRENELKLARLTDERRGIETDDEPESELQKTKRRHEEEDATAKTAQEAKKPDPEFLAKDRQAQRLMKKLGYSESEQERFVTEYPDLDEGLEELDKRYDKKVQKDAEEKAIQAARQSQKASGATKGDGQPSAAGLDDSAFLEAYSKGESDDHARAKKLLSQ